MDFYSACVEIFLHKFLHTMAATTTLSLAGYAILIHVPPTVGSKITYCFFVLKKHNNDTAGTVVKNIIIASYVFEPS